MAAADHGYVDGAQHVRPRAYRASTYDTRLFVLQSDAHAAAHPLDDEAMARVWHDREDVEDLRTAAYLVSIEKVAASYRAKGL